VVTQDYNNVTVICVLNYGIKPKEKKVALISFLQSTITDHTLQLLMQYINLHQANNTVFT